MHGHDLGKVKAQYKSIRAAYHRTVDAVDTLRYPVDETLIPQQVATLVRRLERVGFSSFYKAERERSMAVVTDALLADSDIVHGLRDWPDLSHREAFYLLGTAAAVQARTQVIGSLRAMHPTIVLFQQAKTVNPANGRGTVTLACHSRAALGIYGKTLSNRVEFNTHADARHHYVSARTALSIALHEQQHDMQTAIAATAPENDAAPDLRRDALRLHFSLASNIPATLYTPYRAQLHERDARYAGEGIAARVCEALGIK